MGNAQSVNSDAFSNDPFWNPQPQTMNGPGNEQGSSAGRVHERSEATQRNLHEFRQEFERKHEKRRQILDEKRREFQQLREEVRALKDENEALKQQQQQQQPQPVQCKQSDEFADLQRENDELKLRVRDANAALKDAEEVNARNKELRVSVAEMQLDLQNLNSEMLNIEQERAEYAKHIGALKDVVKVTKDMLEIREAQIQGLKAKVKSVEELLASKEMKLMSEGLREEYEKQLRNIRNLRTLYEERQRLERIEKEHLQVQLDEVKKQLENEQKISSDRLQRIEELEADNSNKYDQITNLQSQLGLSKAECTELQAEIDVINQLFSQILLGFNNTQVIDMDKLIKLLEQNHDLLTDIASNEESNSTAAALPKVLLNLINQIDNESKSEDEESTSCNDQHQLNTPEEIVETLPKVWKVLIELLSHQNPPLSAIKDGEKDPCYKSIETPSGPKLKLSVSQTFIRLKDLIVEKKFLEREMYRLKHLNTHLEGRLQDQEKRLELVSGELATTWRVVEKMQRQHQQLHTHEKVLRYELQEKRKLLTELKEELAYCREKWVAARAKNDSTQEQWKELRKEFAARKTQPDDFNQSAESGFSDDKESSEDDDEKGYESDVSESKRESDCDEHASNAYKDSRQQHCDDQHRQDVDNDAESANEHDDSPSPSTVSEPQTSLTHDSINGTNYTNENEKTNNIVQRLEDCSAELAQKTETTHSSFESHKEDVEQASCSSSTQTRSRTAEEIFAARDARLKRLEEESNKLFKQVTDTNLKSNDISNKLDCLHEIYGENSASTSTTSNENAHTDGDETSKDKSDNVDKTS